MSAADTAAFAGFAALENGADYVLGEALLNAVNAARLAAGFTQQRSRDYIISRADNALLVNGRQLLLIDGPDDLTLRLGLAAIFAGPSSLTLGTAIMVALQTGQLERCKKSQAK